jgi:hypothetical protein
MTTASDSHIVPNLAVWIASVRFDLPANSRQWRISTVYFYNLTQFCDCASVAKEFLSDELGFVFDEKEAGFQFVFDRIDTAVQAG